MSQTSSAKQQLFLTGFASSTIEALGEFGAQGFRFRASATPSDAAAAAVKLSLEKSGVALSKIDFVISSTQTPDFNNPGLVSCLMHRLGMSGIAGLELKQHSSGALYAIELGAQLIATQQATCVLVCCTELLSRYFAKESGAQQTLPEKAGACRRFFADGAAAFLLLSPSAAHQHSQGCYRLVSSRAWSAAARNWSLRCNLPCSSQFPQRITAEDVKAGRHLPLFDLDLYNQELAGLAAGSEFHGAFYAAGEARCIISHQVIEGQNALFARTSSLPDEKFFDIYHSHRYISSAGIPSALALWEQSHAPQGGEKVMLFAAGGGAGCGSAVLERCVDV